MIHRIADWTLDHIVGVLLAFNTVMALLAALVAVAAMGDISVWRKGVVAFACGVMTGASEDPWRRLKAWLGRLLGRPLPELRVTINMPAPGAGSPQHADQDHRTETSQPSATLPPGSSESAHQPDRSFTGICPLCNGKTYWDHDTTWLCARCLTPYEYGD